MDAERSESKAQPREHDIEVYLDGESLSVLSHGRLNGGPDAGLTVVHCTRGRPRRGWFGHVLASGGFCAIRCPHYPPPDSGRQVEGSGPPSQGDPADGFTSGPDPSHPPYSGSSKADQ